MTAASIRAKARAQMIKEIKSAARSHLATEGANLSLRAVARDVGLVSSAVYRYFPSRDDLLTELIMDAFNDIGAAVETTEAAVERADLTGRWMAVCHGVRDWAIAKPHEYALIYGSPVPGYRAPQETVPPATRSVVVLGRILQDAATAGTLHGNPQEVMPEELRADLDVIRDLLGPDVPAAVMAAGISAWAQLIGLVSFELFGHLNNTITDTRLFFDHQMRRKATAIGLTAPGVPMS